MKKVIVIGFISFIFILGVKEVNAMNTSDVYGGSVSYFAGEALTPDGTHSGSCEERADTDNCAALLGDPADDGTCSGKNHGSLAYYLQKGLDIIKYIGIILCIVLTTVDFFKALLSNDKDMLKPLSKKAFSRLIYAVALFFLPIIIKVLFFVVGLYGTCGIQ